MSGTTQQASTALHIAKIKEQLGRLERRTTKPGGSGSAGVGFFNVNDGVYTYTIAAPTDPTDIGFGSHVLAIAAYASGFAPEAALFISPDPANGSGWFSNNGINISALSSPLQLQGDTLTMIAGAGGASITSASDVTIDAGGGNKVNVSPILDVADYILLHDFTGGPAPAAGSARFGVQDNGSGKVQLVWRPPTGGVRVLDTEP